MTQIPFPVARHRRVQCDHQRPVAGPLGPVDQLLGPGPAPEEIELEPGSVRGRGGHLGDGVAGHRAQGHEGAGGPRRAGGGHVAGRVHHAGEPDGAEQQRHQHLATEHGGGEVGGGRPLTGGHPGPEGHLIECVEVGPHRRFGTGAPLDVVPHRSRDPAPRHPPGVGHGANPGRGPPFTYPHGRGRSGRALWSKRRAWRSPVLTDPFPHRLNRSTMAPNCPVRPRDLRRHRRRRSGGWLRGGPRTRRPATR